MSNTFKLGSLPFKIYFADDLPKELAEERKKLSSVVAKLKQQGADAKIVRGKILTDNTFLTEEAIDLIEMQITKKKGRGLKKEK